MKADDHSGNLLARWRQGDLWVPKILSGPEQAHLGAENH
jgi:hypothetical protein